MGASRTAYLQGESWKGERATVRSPLREVVLTTVAWRHQCVKVSDLPLSRCLIVSMVRVGFCLGRNLSSNSCMCKTDCCIYAMLFTVEYQNNFKSVSGSKIYNRVKMLRIERGLSRKQLAKELGVNYQTVGYIERGEYNPSLELAFRASEFFRLPIEAIFSKTPFRPLSEEVYGAPDVVRGAGEGN